MKILVQQNAANVSGEFFFCKFTKENPYAAKCWKCEWRIFLLLIYKGKSLCSKMLKMWVENFSFVNLQRKILVQQNAENVSWDFFCKFPLLTGVHDFIAVVVYHPKLYSIRRKISAFTVVIFASQKSSLWKAWLMSLEMLIFILKEIKTCIYS